MAKFTKRLGGWAFLIGVILAVILGIFGIFLMQSNIELYAWILLILIISGIIIGFLNISESESHNCLLSGVVLVLTAYIGQMTLSGLWESLGLSLTYTILGYIVPLLSNILSAMVMLFVPATIVVALKSLFAIAKD